MRAMIVVAVAAALALPGLAGAADPDWHHPAIPDYGGVVAVPGATDARENGQPYKVVFNVEEAVEAHRPSRQLWLVARFVNLLAESGMDPSKSHIAAVVHGHATRSVLSDSAWEKRYGGGGNPSADLIRALSKVGVEIVVCGQSLAQDGFPADEVRKPVAVGLSAMTELTKRELAGYALMP